MKKLKQIVNDIKALPPEAHDELAQLLWPYICYSPKMPLRLTQEQLLQDAEKISLKVNDEYFAGKELSFNVFKWGNGKHKVLITHGWGSKAADFCELITALRTINDLEIIAFDAPGNGSSEGELSNLLLFKQAIKAIVSEYGKPDVLIGHSLGAMANVIAMREVQIMSSLLISITPLIRLKEKFELSMDAIAIPPAAQTAFLESFNQKFGVPASYFDLDNWYNFDAGLNHWIVFDSTDAVSPYAYLENFLADRTFINARNYEGAGHDRTIKSPIVIADLVGLIDSTLLPE